MGQYPEHDKLTKIADVSQKIGEFLDWLRHERQPFTAICELLPEGDNGEPYWIPAEPGERYNAFEMRKDEEGVLWKRNPAHESWGEQWVRPHLSIQDLLSEYFDIDQKRLEAEKRAMLDSIRAANEERDSAEVASQ